MSLEKEWKKLDVVDGGGASTVINKNSNRSTNTGVTLVFVKKISLFCIREFVCFLLTRGNRFIKWRNNLIRLKKEKKKEAANFRRTDLGPSAVFLIWAFLAFLLCFIVRPSLL